MHDDAQAARRRRRTRWAFAGAAVLLLAGAVAVYAAQQVPYYSLSPGSLYPTTDLVLVEEVEPDDPTGEVLFTTVSVNKLTRFERWLAEQDGDVDILAEEIVAGDRTPDENRAFNQRLMADSKQTAIAVALEQLGEDVVLTGTGAGVGQVVPDVPAAEVIEAGDTIIEAGGEPIALADDLVAVIEDHEPGDVLSLVVEDLAGETREVDAELVERDEDPGEPMLGVSIETRDRGIELPFLIDIDTGSVGGPSAGLAMALAVLDVLTPGELTGGHRVATTGTIDLAGQVGAVGGVKQKTISARDDGVELFLVPAAEADEAREHAGDMRVVGVEVLEDALVALVELGGEPLPDALDRAP